MKQTWIFSVEPDVFPWSEVEKKKTARWDGIRGPAARKFMRSIKKGDLVLGYHSSPEKRLVCLAGALGAAYPDPADEAWLAVDIAFKKWLNKPVPLAAMKAQKKLLEMPFLRIPRLSIAPVDDAQKEVLSGLSETSL